MDFKLNWEKYNEISVHDIEDNLQVVFPGKQYFKAIDGQSFV